MSELDLHDLPPLPPARPMTDEDWERLHAHVFGAIAAYERRRRTRLLLIAAAVLVVALLAIAAAWQLSQPSANSRADVSVACASDASSSPASLAFVTLDGIDPVARCQREWAAGGVVVDQTVAPPLTACSRVDRPATVAVTVFPTLPGGTCARLGYDPLPQEYAAYAARFGQIHDALVAWGAAGGGSCKPYDETRDVAERAIADVGLDDWEVARDGSFDGDDACLSHWVFDYDQRLLFLFGNR